MTKYISRTRRVKAVATSLLLVPLLFSLGGCWLFNIPPLAGFTISPKEGQAPLAVNFSAVLSEDEDGTIILFEWDFGDGTSGKGENVTHTYTTVGTYSIVLRVTDDDGETATNGKTIYVTPAEPDGPTASFTASPTSGAASSLTVHVDARASSYDAGVISQWVWTWGDGKTGYGEMPQSHTYYSAGSVTYTLTLTVTGTDGKTGAATRSISLTPGGTTSTAGDPSARFTVDYTSGVAPLQVTFDPSDSKADEGRTIILYMWSFGDGSGISDISATTKEHVFTTDASSEVFSVTLMVTDNQGGSNSITKTVKAYNHRPIAGFEIGNPPGGDGTGVVQYISSTTPVLGTNVPKYDYDDPSSPSPVDQHRDEWCPDNVVYGNLTGLQTASVVIRSKKIPDNRWRALASVVQKDLVLADGTSARSTSTPGEPTGYDDHNYSYDAEGQAWTGGVYPGWFPSLAFQAWGIRYLHIDWGDNTVTQGIDFVGNDDTVAWHVYDCSTDGKVFKITVTAEDYLGHKSAAFSRYVTIKKGLEGGGDL